MNLVTVHAFVSGKVQGVYYRDTVRRKALAQAISGWVRNLSDGRVEVMATGDFLTLSMNLQIGYGRAHQPLK